LWKGGGYKFFIDGSSRIDSDDLVRGRIDGCGRRHGKGLGMILFRD